MGDLGRLQGDLVRVIDDINAAGKLSNQDSDKLSRLAKTRPEWRDKNKGRKTPSGSRSALGRRLPSESLGACRAAEPGGAASEHARSPSSSAISYISSPRAGPAATITMTESPVLPLLQTVFTSILEVFLLCLAGYILASRGILDKKTQKQLNRLNVSLFTPALLFSKVAFFLSPAKLRELWIIPIFFIVVTLLSMGVAFALGWLFGLKRSQRNFAMAAAMFMNSNSLPIALMQSLVVTVPHLKWGADDNADAMVGRALTYLVMYSTLGMVLRWSYGVRLLAQADDAEPVIVIEPEAHERSLLLSDSQATLPASRVAGAPARLKLPRRKDSVFHSFPNTPNISSANLAASASTSASTLATSSSNTSDSDDGSDNDDDGAEALPAHRRHPTTPTSSRLQSALRRARRRAGRAWGTFSEFMTVPLWAAVLSLVVACIRPLQHLLEEHAQPIKGSLASAGNCSIPVTLVVLGAYFYAPPAPGARRRGLREMIGWKTRSGSASPQQKPVERPGETRTVVIAIAARMVLVPLLLMPLMALSTLYDWQAVFEDPVFVVANVLLISSPPALTLAQITQAAASGDAFERLISRTIFWSYCVVTPPATILYVVIGMLLAKL
ncbi:hypothetical protein HWV62_35378 [Athelia sp. TMB]|nr:hypothetical protein HWV62_35378 [Athelia sp. TMB]